MGFSVPEDNEDGSNPIIIKGSALSALNGEDKEGFGQKAILKLLEALKTLTSITTPRYMSYQLSTSKAFWICSSSNNVSYCLFYCFFINVFHKSYCRFDRSFDIVSDKESVIPLILP